MGLISRVSSRTYRKTFDPKTSTTMGRMHAPGKGMSSSALPYVRKAPTWLRLSKDEIVESIIKLSKKGYRPSAIGFPIRIRHRKQNPPSLESSRYGPRNPRRSLLLDQKSRHRPKAFGKEPKRQTR